ncbi:MAG: hypothetical protein P8Y23_12825 [Candidatus Lokiarchaeota archaeon]|jgi:hypothetical protein
MQQGLNIHHFHRFLDVLEDLKKKQNCQLNLTKLFEIWGISNEELEPFVQTLLRFQALLIKKKNSIRFSGVWKNAQIYIRLNSVSKYNVNKKIELSVGDCHLLNDMIHYFEHIKIGSSFNIKANNTVFISKIKKFSKLHPYFFEKRGSNALYPTKLASKLGKTIETYNKANRMIQDIQLDGYQITVR